MRAIVTALTLGAALGIGFRLIQPGAQDIPAVTADEAQRLIATDSSIIVLDVRTPGEFAEMHINGAVLIPVQELEERIGELEPYRERTILAVCRTGRRSAIATTILNKAGFRAYNVEGGMVRWSEKGFPSVQGK